MLSYNPSAKRLGSYLLDAGLLTEAQIDVALNDQEATGLRFGDVLVERGWITRKTIEYITYKVIELERQLGEPLEPGILQSSYSIRKRKKQDPFHG